MQDIRRITKQKYIASPHLIRGEEATMGRDNETIEAKTSINLKNAPTVGRSVFYFVLILQFRRFF